MYCSKLGSFSLTQDLYSETTWNIKPKLSSLASMVGFYGTSGGKGKHSPYLTSLKIVVMFK
jgi:hypothetical protein